jgi:hypothetical protein
MARLVSSLILTTEQEAEQTAINNIVIACGIDAVLLEDCFHGSKDRFAAVALSTWEHAQRERNALYYQFTLVQVFERGDYDAPPVEEMEEMADVACAHEAPSLQPAQPLASRNRLRVDALETGMGRCLLKKPAHWPASASALRWVASGGEPFVFGTCSGRQSSRCPLNREVAIER